MTSLLACGGAARPTPRPIPEVRYVPTPPAPCMGIAPPEPPRPPSECPAGSPTCDLDDLYTALTLAIGVATWFFSDLKFQADMGLMLTFLFVVNMVAAIVFLPALCRFLLRPTEKDTWKPPA
jgi:hypothetical protein